MNRTALRLATLAALTNGGKEPWPTLANDSVYDSRRDMLNDVHERLRRPVIVIRTDNDARDNRGPNGLYNKQQARQTQMLLEISVVTASKERNPETGEDEWVLGWPQTDPTLEAMLDMLEYQIEVALFGVTPWGGWWRNRGWQPLDLTSVPEFSRDPVAVRLAARTLTMNIQMPPDCLPGWRFDDEPAKPPQPPRLFLEVLADLLANVDGDLLAAVTQMKTVLDSRGWPEETAWPQLIRVRSEVVIGRFKMLDAELREGLNSLNFSNEDNSQNLLLWDAEFFVVLPSLQFFAGGNSQYIPLLMEDI